MDWSGGILRALCCSNAVSPQGCSEHLCKAEGIFKVSMTSCQESPWRPSMHESVSVHRLQIMEVRRAFLSNSPTTMPSPVQPAFGHNDADDNHYAVLSVSSS